MEKRFGGDMKVDFEVDPTIGNALVPQLILQPLVENSVRYARDPITLKVTVCIRAVRDGENIMLEVRDQGPGIPNLECGGWQKGIGISNTEERLRGMYGPDHKMVLENRQGLVVTIRMPFRREVAL
jgi:two-component system LytT family sensor kinase